MFHPRAVQPTASRAGYTLVEMAVVVTIISLLVGGVLVGQNMIRSANIQSTVAGVETYRSAIMKFQDRFLELPGDFQTATSNWSGNNITNGNGNGRIGGDNAAVPSLNNDCVATDWQEQWNVWVHLSKAELISGEYFNSGNTNTVYINKDPAVTNSPNVPQTEIDKGGYTLRFCGDITSSSTYFNATYGHTMQVGNGLSTQGGSRRGLFSPKEAAAIDGKVDDGFPHKGKVLAPKMSDNYAPNCSNSDTNAPATADYLFSETGKNCALFFILGF